MALVYLLASAEVELVGVASTGGNVAVDQVCVNNLGLLELCGVTAVPVSEGAERPLCGRTHTAENIHGPQGLGYAELAPGSGRLTGHDAASAWVRAAHAHPGQLIGVVTGPLTNLALALRTEPALPTLLRRLVIMGGSFDHRGNVTAAAEFNIRVDPEAAAEVFTAWGPLGPQQLPIVCGLELTEHIAMTPAILSRLSAAGGCSATTRECQQRGIRSTASNTLIRVLEDAMRFYFEAHYDRGRGYLAYLHDPLAAAVALEPGLITTRPAAVHVELVDTSVRGRTVPDWSGDREPNAQIGVHVDPETFFERFIERVGAFARQLD
jgi:purine nucleosidase